MMAVPYSRNMQLCRLTLILLTWTIWRAPTNASKWRMGFNSAFKGLSKVLCIDGLFHCYRKFHYYVVTARKTHYKIV